MMSCGSVTSSAYLGRVRVRVRVSVRVRVRVTSSA